MNDPAILLERHMLKHGKSQRQLAHEAGIAEADLSRYLRGRTPSVENAFAIERATRGEVPAKAWVNGNGKRKG